MVIFNLVKQRIFQYPRLGMFWDKARWSPISANMTIWYVVYWSSKRVETTKHHQTIAGKLSCALPLFLYFSLFFSLSISLSLSLFFSFFSFLSFSPSLSLSLSRSSTLKTTFQDIGMQSMQKLVEPASAIGSCWAPQSTFLNVTRCSRRLDIVTLERDHMPRLISCFLGFPPIKSLGPLSFSLVSEGHSASKVNTRPGPSFLIWPNGNRTIHLKGLW